MWEEKRRELRQHKNWYFVSVCLHDSMTEFGLSWLCFVVFTDIKKEAHEKAICYAERHRTDNQKFNKIYGDHQNSDISLYRNNYIRDAEILVARGMYC